jgi:hypothetical protein
MTPFNMSPFNNADLTVTRTKGARTAKGYEESGTTTVLECRCDYQGQGEGYQAQGEKLRSLQQLHQINGAKIFAEKDVGPVQPGDDVTVTHDDGGTTSGAVESVMAIDDSLLIET